MKTKREKILFDFIGNCYRGMSSSFAPPRALAGSSAGVMTAMLLLACSDNAWAREESLPPVPFRQALDPVNIILEAAIDKVEIGVHKYYETAYQLLPTDDKACRAFRKGAEDRFFVILRTRNGIVHFARNPAESKNYTNRIALRMSEGDPCGAYAFFTREMKLRRYLFLLSHLPKSEGEKEVLLTGLPMPDIENGSAPKQWFHNNQSFCPEYIQPVAILRELIEAISENNK
ncbi:hypothetical protein FNU76_23455 [Chitinimonas arctica]|uniref:Uncharacterized protein n=1 Tax=Chitinimonas arctica TaxID=2594795 RepID=A0A516SLN8_9NEIS|nr:hypothetical protein [Chitinimonas arctica]QDQ29067.1 hypothetical protein FNU76_23455 [Chitinimonas arctica]